jgi:membrane-bound lytic murein transglycosylase MltF
MKEDTSRQAVKKVAARMVGALQKLQGDMPLGPGNVELSRTELQKLIREGAPETRQKLAQTMSFEEMLEIIRG